MFLDSDSSGSRGEEGEEGRRGCWVQSGVTSQPQWGDMVSKEISWIYQKKKYIVIYSLISDMTSYGDCDGDGDGDGDGIYCFV